MNFTRSSLLGIGTALATIAAILIAGPAVADTTFGVRAGYYTDASAGFLGGEILTTMAPSWHFNPNLEVALSDSHDVITLNGDVHYDFFKDRPYYVWAGAGPALIHRAEQFESNTTDFGVNVLGGMGWRTRSKYLPYVQGKVTIADDQEAVIGIGMRF